MRRKHYAIGAAILTIGAAAAVVLLPKGQDGAGLEGIAYLPSGMTSPFSAPPAVKLPLAEIEAPVIPAQPEAPVKVAEIPTSAPADIPAPFVRHARPAQPLAEIPVANEAPSDTPFVWHGSGGRGQSWKGTGGRAVALNDGPSAGGFSGGGGGGGGGLSASNHPLENPPSLPPSSTTTSSGPSGKPKAPTLTNGNNPGTQVASITSNVSSAGGSGNTPSGGSGFRNGAGSSSSIVTPDGPNDGGQGFINGPAQYASYEAPDGPQLNAVTVDEPGALSILLVGALGLLVARRANKRNVA